MKPLQSGMNGLVFTESPSNDTPTHCSFGELVGVSVKLLIVVIVGALCAGFEPTPDGCVPCPPGQYGMDRNSCNNCPPGFYSWSLGSWACTVSDEGT